MTTLLRIGGAAATLATVLIGPAQADPITLTDLAGRTVELDRPAERIVTLPVPMAATVIALDQGAERLVGIHPEIEDRRRGRISGHHLPRA